MDELTRIIIEDILVFAYCSDDQMDQDFAVAQLERISEQIRSFDVNGINRFVEIVHIMEQEARNQGLTERGEQLAQMPEHLGLE